MCSNDDSCGIKLSPSPNAIGFSASQLQELHLHFVLLLRFTFISTHPAWHWRLPRSYGKRTTKSRQERLPASLFHRRLRAILSLSMLFGITRAQREFPTISGVPLRARAVPQGGAPVTA